MMRPIAMCALALAGLGFALLAPTPSTARAAEPPAIPWRSDFAAARAESRSQGRPLWVQFTGPWCGYCRLMERESFTRPEVIAAARDQFVPVQVRSDLQPELVAQFGVEGLPSTILLSPTGQVLGRLEGYADPASFRALLAQAVAQ